MPDPQQNVMDPPTNTPERYRGSEELNPEQRPLSIPTDGLSNTDIDEILAVAGPEDHVFMTDAELEELAKQTPAPEKKDEKPPEPPPPKPDEKPPEPPPPPATEEEAVARESAAVLDGLKLKQEDFAKLPENIQSALVEAHIQKAAPPATQEQQAKIQQLEQDVATMRADPTIAARIQELQDQKSYVARAIPLVQPGELPADLLSKLDSAISEDRSADAAKLIAEYTNKVFRERVTEAVRIERAVQDRQRSIQQKQDAAWSVVMKLGEIDKRLEARPEWQTSPPPQDSEVAKLITFLKEKKYTCEQVVDQGPKVLYAAYAAAQGWDQQAHENIAKVSRDKVLAALKNPKKAARPMGAPAAPSNAMRPGAGAAFDRETLKRELLEGNQETYLRLLDAVDRSGDEKLEGQINAVWDEAMEERRRNQQQGA